METITDVLRLLVQLAPMREESVVNEALSILEKGRTELDKLMTKSESTVEDVKADIPTTGNAAVPTVAGL
jgi:hypothetical protein